METDRSGHTFREKLRRSRRIVVKVGSGVLVDARHQLHTARITALTGSLARLMKRGVQLVLVCSGAVAAGAPLMDLQGRAKTIPQKQACAAVGQIRLMALYERLIGEQGRHTAQILLTQADMRNRERYLNAKNTFETLLEAGILPIVNENDSVVVEEIKFGDNDNLSAQVAALVQADLLLILSSVGGFYEGPIASADAGARPVSVVETITARHFEQARDVESSEGISTGGMRSKLLAIQKAAQYGVATVLASGLTEDAIEKVLSGKDEGTLFLPAEERLSARKHWILHSLLPAGTLTVDAGAVAALMRQGTSLLPIGISAVSGEFQSGNAVRIVGPDGREIARGLTHYSSAEVAAIRGRRSEEIESLLGYSYYDEVIHRDNLVLIRREVVDQEGRGT